MSTQPDTVSAAEQIADLQHQINVMAWLHAALVYELRTLLAQLVGPTSNPDHAKIIRDRAIRIAQYRAAQTGALK
jgi:hypothetical protein